MKLEEAITYAIMSYGHGKTTDQIAAAINRNGWHIRKGGKPSDGLFDAVAAGRVLILSPWDYDADKRHVTRADCVAMNQMAEEICNHCSLSSAPPNSIALSSIEPD